MLTSPCCLLKLIADADLICQSCRRAAGAVRPRRRRCAFPAQELHHRRPRHAQLVFPRPQPFRHPSGARGARFFHRRFHRYIHLPACRLGIAGCYVTSPAKGDVTSVRINVIVDFVWGSRSSIKTILHTLCDEGRCNVWPPLLINKEFPKPVKKGCQAIVPAIVKLSKRSTSTFKLKNTGKTLKEYTFTCLESGARCWHEHTLHFNAPSSAQWIQAPKKQAEIAKKPKRNKRWSLPSMATLND
jgi:hypothetical protein